MVIPNGFTSFWIILSIVKHVLCFKCEENYLSEEFSSQKCAEYPPWMNKDDFIVPLFKMDSLKNMMGINVKGKQKITSAFTTPKSYAAGDPMFDSEYISSECIKSTSIKNDAKKKFLRKTKKAKKSSVTTESIKKTSTKAHHSESVDSPSVEVMSLPAFLDKDGPGTLPCREWGGDLPRVGFSIGPASTHSAWGGVEEEQLGKAPFEGESPNRRKPQQTLENEVGMASHIDNFKGVEKNHFQKIFHDQEKEQVSLGSKVIINNYHTPFSGEDVVNYLSRDYYMLDKRQTERIAPFILRQREKEMSNELEKQTETPFRSMYKKNEEKHIIDHTEVLPVNNRSNNTNYLENTHFQKDDYTALKLHKCSTSHSEYYGKYHNSYNNSAKHRPLINYTKNESMIDRHTREFDISMTENYKYNVKNKQEISNLINTKYTKASPIPNADKSHNKVYNIISVKSYRGTPEPINRFKPRNFYNTEKYCPQNKVYHTESLYFRSKIPDSANEKHKSKHSDSFRPENYNSRVPEFQNPENYNREHSESYHPDNYDRLEPITFHPTEKYGTLSKEYNTESMNSRSAIPDSVNGKYEGVQSDSYKPEKIRRVPPESYKLEKGKKEPSAYYNIKKDVRRSTSKSYNPKKDYRVHSDYYNPEKDDTGPSRPEIPESVNGKYKTDQSYLYNTKKYNRDRPGFDNPEKYNTGHDYYNPERHEQGSPRSYNPDKYDILELRNSYNTEKYGALNTVTNTEFINSLAEIPYSGNENYKTEQSEFYNPEIYDKRPSDSYNPEEYSRASTEYYDTEKVYRENSDYNIPEIYDKRPSDSYNPEKYDRNSSESYDPENVYIGNSDYYNPEIFEQRPSDSYNPEKYNKVSSESYDPDNVYSGNSDYYNPEICDKRASDSYKPGKYERDSSESYDPENVYRGQADYYDPEIFDTSPPDSYNPEKYNKVSSEYYDPENVYRGNSDYHNPDIYDRGHSDNYNPDKYDRLYHTEKYGAVKKEYNIKSMNSRTEIPQSENEKYKTDQTYLYKPEEYNRDPSESYNFPPEKSCTGHHDFYDTLKNDGGHFDNDYLEKYDRRSSDSRNVDQYDDHAEFPSFRNTEKYGALNSEFNTESMNYRLEITDSVNEIYKGKQTDFYNSEKYSRVPSESYNSEMHPRGHSNHYIPVKYNMVRPVSYSPGKNNGDPSDTNYPGKFSKTFPVYYNTEKYNRRQPDPYYAKKYNKWPSDHYNYNKNNGGSNSFHQKGTRGPSYTPGNRGKSDRGVPRSYLGRTNDKGAPNSSHRGKNNYGEPSGPYISNTNVRVPESRDLDQYNRRSTQVYLEKYTSFNNRHYIASVHPPNVNPVPEKKNYTGKYVFNPSKLNSLRSNVIMMNKTFREKNSVLLNQKNNRDIMNNFINKTPEFQSTKYYKKFKNGSFLNDEYNQESKIILSNQNNLKNSLYKEKQKDASKVKEGCTVSQLSTGTLINTSSFQNYNSVKLVRDNELEDFPEIYRGFCHKTGSNKEHDGFYGNTQKTSFKKLDSKQDEEIIQVSNYNTGTTTNFIKPITSLTNSTEFCEISKLNNESKMENYFKVHLEQEKKKYLETLKNMSEPKSGVNQDKKENMTPKINCKNSTRNLEKNTPMLVNADRSSWNERSHTINNINETMWAELDSPSSYGVNRGENIFINRKRTTTRKPEDKVSSTSRYTSTTFIRKRFEEILDAGVNGVTPKVGGKIFIPFQETNTNREMYTRSGAEISSTDSISKLNFTDNSDKPIDHATPHEPSNTRSDKEPSYEEEPNPSRKISPDHENDVKASKNEYLRNEISQRKNRLNSFYGTNVVTPYIANDFSELQDYFDNEISGNENFKKVQKLLNGPISQEKSNSSKREEENEGEYSVVNMSIIKVIHKLPEREVGSTSRNAHSEEGKLMGFMKSLGNGYKFPEVKVEFPKQYFRNILPEDENRFSNKENCSTEEKIMENPESNWKAKIQARIDDNRFLGRSRKVGRYPNFLTNLVNRKLGHLNIGHPADNKFLYGIQ